MRPPRRATILTRISSVSAGTLQDPLADAASDHYPVVATLAW